MFAAVFRVAGAPADPPISEVFLVQEPCADIQ
jgi:hypothetical protein